LTDGHYAAGHGTDHKRQQGALLSSASHRNGPRINVLERARDMGMELPAPAARRIDDYLDLLVQWNRKTNLVGPRDGKTIFKTLIVDSLHLAPFLDGLNLPDSPLCLDLGAGAGLPGIPLRCIWRKGRYHLVEVREKRCVFMRLAVGRLDLEQTHVFQGRAQDAVQQISTSKTPSPARKPDLILSRAFMPWAELLPFVKTMLAQNGHVVVLANEAAPQNLPPNWTLEKEHAYPVPAKDEDSTRWFWCLRLNEKTA